ncbi:MAG: YbjN domain-containing protein [Sphingobacteriales bacterium]|nr:YbjN domain-containing protein [Sphingobacteriales bacterium]
MSYTLDLVISHLKSINFQFRLDEDRELVRFGVAMRNCKLEVIIHVQEDRDILRCYALLPFNVPSNKRHEVAEFITRANYGLIIGNFEMDFEDGELRYKSTMNTDGGAVNEEVIRCLIHANIQTVDKYAIGVLKIVYADMEPKEAVKLVEHSDEDDNIDDLLRDLLSNNN